MGLGHLFGLGGGVTVRCRDCGAHATVDPEDDEPACPECGSTDLAEFARL